MELLLSFSKSYMSGILPSAVEVYNVEICIDGQVAKSEYYDWNGVDVYLSKLGVPRDAIIRKLLNGVELGRPEIQLRNINVPISDGKTLNYIVLKSQLITRYDSEFYTYHKRALAANPKRK